MEAEAKNLGYKTGMIDITKPANFVLLILILGVIPLFVDSPYHLNLILISLMYSVLAMTFVLVLRTGLINMAISTFWAAGAYCSALLVTKIHVSFWLAMPASGITAALIALILGYIFIKNPGFSFVIMTMIVGMLTVVVIGNLKFFGGFAGIGNIPAPDSINIPLVPEIIFFGKKPFYYLMLFLFSISIIIMSAFYSAWTGRAWTAIGLNSRLAQSLGIDIFKYRLLGFVLSAGICGLMGSFYAHYQWYIKPETFNIFKGIYVQVYAILGGIGFPFLGSIVGTFVMIFFPEFLRITQAVSPILMGVLLIVVIVFMPAGILSLPGIKSFFTNPVLFIFNLFKKLKAKIISNKDLKEV